MTQNNTAPCGYVRLIVVVCLCLSGCTAIPGSNRKATYHSPWALPPSSEFLAKMDPPPAPNSPEAKRQINEILAIQATATPGKIAEARWTYRFSLFIFSLALDPDFDPSHYPKSATFFRKLNDLIESVNSDLKNTYRSPHPFQVDSRVKRFVIAVPGYDYPSYHATRCVVFERVLAQLDPNRAKAFHEVALMVEQDRVFAGEHFPYSIVAGRKLGHMIYSELERDKNFRQQITDLKVAEWTPPPSSRDSF